jgi:hypothetical protein
MFCGNCGAANNDGSKFCLQCGAALESQEQPVYQDAGSRTEVTAGKNRLMVFLKKRWMIVAPAAVVIVILLFCLNSIRAAFDPTFAVERATDTTFSLLEKRMDNSPLKVISAFDDCTKNGTLGLSFSYDSGYGYDVSGDISVLSNSSKKNYGVIANLSVNDEAFDITALLNSNRLAFNSSLIDDKYYGIAFDSYDKDIKEFAKAADLDDYTVESITSVVDSLRSVTNPADTKFIDKYGELIETSVKNQPVTSSEQISLDGETIGCKVVKYEITEDDLEKLLNDFFEMFENDKEIRDYFMANINNPSLSSLYAMFGYYNYSYYGIPGEQDAEAVYDTMLDNMRNAIDSFKDVYSGKINMSYYISGNKLVRFELAGSPKISGEKVGFDFSIDFGKSPDKNDIVINMSASDNYGSEIGLKATLQSEYKSGVQTNELKIKASEGGYSESVLLKSEWTKKTGELVLSIEAGGEEYEMEGNLKYVNGGFKLVLDDLIDSSMGIGSLDLTITAQKGTKIPNPDYINLDKWDSDLISDLEDALSGFSGMGGSNDFYDDNPLFDDAFN